MGRFRLELGKGDHFESEPTELAFKARADMAVLLADWNP
jgi:hypothetical protein